LTDADKQVERVVRDALMHYYQRDPDALQQLVRKLARELLELRKK
jgi:hypothetical protein